MSTPTIRTLSKKGRVTFGPFKRDEVVNPVEQLLVSVTESEKDSPSWSDLGSDRSEFGFRIGPPKTRRESRRSTSIEKKILINRKYI